MACSLRTGCLCSPRYQRLFPTKSSQCGNQAEWTVSVPLPFGPVPPAASIKRTYLEETVCVWSVVRAGLGFLSVVKAKHTNNQRTNPIPPRLSSSSHLTSQLSPSRTNHSSSEPLAAGGMRGGNSSHGHFCLVSVLLNLYLKLCPWEAAWEERRPRSRLRQVPS